jgi:acylphosphatase
MAKLARRIVVYGMVQGVGFRYFAQRLGKRLGLSGDVRNLPDAAVEIVVEGNVGPMDEFIQAVKRGPSMAHVDRLEIHEIAVGGRSPTFTIEGW